MAQIKNDELSNEDSLYFIKLYINTSTVDLIRYDNSINSTEWTIPNSIDDFNGEKLWVLTDQEEKLKELFPKTTIIKTNKGPNDLFNELLYENVNGLLMDENIVDYYKKNNNRISAYPNKLANNSYGFLFNN